MCYATGAKRNVLSRAKLSASFSSSVAKKSSSVGALHMAGAPYDTVMRLAQIVETTWTSSDQSTARMSERLRSSR